MSTRLRKALIIVSIVIAGLGALVAVSVAGGAAMYGLTYRFPPHIASEFHDALDALADPEGTLQHAERYDGCHPLAWDWFENKRCTLSGPHDAAYALAWYPESPNTADAKARFYALRSSLPATVNGVQIGSATMLPTAPGVTGRWDFVAPVRFTDGTLLEMDCSYVDMDGDFTPASAAYFNPNADRGLVCGISIER